MKGKGYKIIVIVLVLVVAILAFRVIFDKKFDDFDNFVETRENYEGGTEKFDKDFEGLVEWEKNYRKDHPNATKEDIDKAFKDAWGK